MTDSFVIHPVLPVSGKSIMFKSAVFQLICGLLACLVSLFSLWCAIVMCLNVAKVPAYY
jgi:hypothetical protein